MPHNRLILNRYTPLGEAGSGGFATVQIAWDTRIQRKVAIKCIELEELATTFNRVQPRRGDAREARGGAFDQTHGGAFTRQGSSGVSFDEQKTISIGGLEGASGLWGDAGATAPLDQRDAQGPMIAEERSGQDDFSAAVRAYLRVPGLDEARTAALLTDANIVAVYDFEVQGTTAYLIMEYVEGLTLTQLLERYGSEMTLDAVASVFSSVAHALDVAHENQVLHLDIKPDNILIDHKGRVKVTDFGLAKLAGASGFGAAGGGTIGYMPLEQMRGELLDVRCDEWALASVTYEMLTGENPFLAHTLPQAEAAIVDAELVLPSLCWEGLDDQADDVLFYALDPNREERYDTVADFAEEMEKFLGDAKRGQRELASLVSCADSDDAALDEDEPVSDKREKRHREPFSLRVGRMPKAVAGRAAAAAGSAFVAWVGLGNLPGVAGFDNPLFWALLALAGVLGAAVPSVGVLAAYLIVSAALIAQGALAVGCALAVATGLWWWFVGRQGTASANVALAAPVAGAVGAAALAPFAAGAVLRPARAVGATLFSGVVSVIFASFGSASLFGWEAMRHAHFAGMLLQRELLSLLTQPATWVVIAGWLIAALVLALFRLRSTRTTTWIGVAACAVVLVAADCLRSGFLSGYSDWTPSPEVFVSIAICAALVGVAACAFPQQKELFEDEELLSDFDSREG